MIVENEFKTIMNKDEYSSLIDNIESVIGKYVILLKSLPATINNRDCTIEKGSLAKINDIIMYRAKYSEDSRNQDLYIDEIDINFINDDRIVTVKVWSENNADNFTKDEDCINNLHTAMQYLNDTFGTANEIDTIGKKLDARPRIFKIGCGILYCLLTIILGILIYKWFKSDDFISQAFGYTFGYMFLAASHIWGWLTLYDTNGIVVNFAKKLYHKLWKKYDDSITDFVVTGVCSEIKSLEKQKDILLIEQKDNITNILPYTNDQNKKVN